MAKGLANRSVRSAVSTARRNWHSVPAAMEIEETLSEIERFFERASQVDGVEAWPRVLPPASDADIDALARTFELTIPDDVGRFWRRGSVWKPASATRRTALRLPGSSGASSATSIAISRCTGRRLLRSTKRIPTSGACSRRGYRSATASRRSSGTRRAAFFTFSTHNDLHPPVTRSFGEFLEHWLESGCFESHAITRWLPTIQHLVPGRIPPEKNLWIAYYKKVFAAYA